MRSNNRIKMFLAALLGTAALTVSVPVTLVLSAAPAAAASRDDDCYALYESTLSTCDSIAANGGDPAPCYHAALGNLRECLKG